MADIEGTAMQIAYRCIKDVLNGTDFETAEDKLDMIKWYVNSAERKIKNGEL